MQNSLKGQIVFPCGRCLVAELVQRSSSAVEGMYLKISEYMYTSPVVFMEVLGSHVVELLIYNMHGQKCLYWDRQFWLMSICFFARCVHAYWPCASTLDGISCNGSFFCVCRAVFTAAEMASCLILINWGTIGSTAAGPQVKCYFGLSLHRSMWQFFSLGLYFLILGSKRDTRHYYEHTWTKAVLSIL